MQVILSVCMAIALVETCCGDYHPEIKWQAHSYNDMRSWPALFRKGTSFLKIDVNWQRGWLCREQVRVVNRTDSRGCFILNHNDPSLIAYRKDYNTTADLVSILASPSHPLYRHFAQERRVIVALCFKGPMNSMCDNGTDTLAWISLVDELVTSLNRVRASDPLLNVEFVLDGGVPQACLIQRWRPWVSTGGSAVAFTANDTATGSDRWQVMNPSWPAMMKQYAAAKWGKFVNSSYPFQVWEPCNQDDILAASGVYDGVGISHPPGLRFAINIDVAQFEVYASDVTGRGLNEIVGDLSEPAIVQTAGHGFLISSLTPSDDVQVQYHTNSKPVRSLTTAQPLPHWTRQDGAPTTLSTLACPREMVVVSSATTGHAALYDIEASGQLSFLSSSSTQNVVGPTTAIVKAPPCDSSTRVPLLATAVLRPSTSCALSVALLDKSFNVVGSSACVLNSMPSLIAASEVTIVAVWQNSSQVVSVFVFYPSSNFIYSGAVTFSLTGGIKTTIPPKAFDVGISTSATAAVDVMSGEIVIAIATSGSYCFNTELRNKQAGTASCQQKPIAQGAGISYTIGTLDQWQAQFNALGMGETINNCATLVLHGTLTQGHNPRVVLYAHHNRTHFGVLHSTNVTADPFICGLPSTRKNGTVVDAWELPVGWTSQ